MSNLTDSWRTTDQPAPHIGPNEGDACTINGQRGTIQRRGDKLVCVPTNDTDAATVPRSMSAADAQVIRDRAWEEMCERQRNAWKTKP